MAPSDAPIHPAYFQIRRAAVIVSIGVGAGIGGAFLALLLHAVQHIAYGYSLDRLVGTESFLTGVTAATPGRRFAALLVCGLVAGCGWGALYRWGKPLVSIRKAVGAADPRMPVSSTIIHALLQIVTVALGSPLGREVAPREIGALWSGWIAHRAGLPSADQRVLVACGAGAGLAAVYNVPLGGAVFVLEVLLCTFAFSTLVPALATSAIAAFVAQFWLGNEHQYTVPHYVVDQTLLVGAIVCGPLFGAAAWVFVALTSRARAHAPKDLRLPMYALINFVVIGALVIGFPALAGNGRGPAGLAFDGALPLGLAALLLILKVAIEVSTLRSGAEGGLLTPGLTNGALLALVLGGLWRLHFPGAPLGAFAVVGAGAFLAASMQMPITAIVLLLEFTHFDHDMVMPVLFAVVGSISAFKVLAYLKS